MLYVFNLLNSSVQLATSNLHRVAGEWSGLVLYPFSSAEFCGFVGPRDPVRYFSVYLVEA